MEIHDIREVLQKINQSEPENVVIAVIILNFGFLSMMVGLFIWVLTFNPLIIHTTENFFLFTILGSSFVGVTTFCYSLGSYHYFRYHIKHLPVRWQFQGIMRTFLQFYYWGSILILFVIAQFLSPRLGIDYILLLIIISIPAHTGLFIARWNMVKDLLEKYTEKKFGRSVDLF